MFDRVISAGVARGFHRSGWGSRLEGHGFWLEFVGDKVKITHNDTLIPNFEVILTPDETVSWLCRNTWGK